MTAPLAIWDVDGTLVDSRETIGWCMSEAFAAAGLPRPTYDQTRRIVGLTLLEAVGILAPSEPAETHAAIVEAYKAAFQGLHADPAYREPLYPGAEALLAELTARGWRQAVATGKSRRGLDRIIEAHGWGEVFCSLHCSDDGPGKPHPAMVLAALAATGTPPEHAVMIGDTTHDIRMGRAAGVRAIAVAWGFHTAEELAGSGPDALCASWPDLSAALTGANGPAGAWRGFGAEHHASDPRRADSRRR